LLNKFLRQFYLRHSSPINHFRANLSDRISFEEEAIAFLMASLSHQGGGSGYKLDGKRVLGFEVGLME
jgi:hypothetical protein